MTTSTTNRPGWYTVDCGVFQYTLPERYKDPSPIGQGAFGAVIRATDSETGKTVAIKKLIRPFETPKHAQRTYRELKLLMYLNHPDAQIVQLYNVFTPEENINEFQTVYFVLSFSDFDLNKVIRHQKPFTEKHIRLIIYSILRGLKFMHSAGILHRDLKPQNIGINQNSDVAILDFGLARVSSIGDHTTYVATRWWRAPEVSLSPKEYGAELDIWAVGCIMGELILLRTLFPGSDAMDQIKKILELVGTPDKTVLEEICAAVPFQELIQLEEKPRKNFKELFGYKYGPQSDVPIFGVSEQGIDLLEQLLTFDHRKRPTAEQALAHPFFEHLHDPMDEPTTALMVDEHQGQNYSIATWKSIIWQMVEEFIPPSWVNDNDDDEFEENTQ